MKRILVEVPILIETPRLELHMPTAGWGKQVHEAVLDGYESYVKWLCWPPTPPTVEMVEEECRKNHADFVLREFIRYIIIEKSTGIVLGRCAFPPFQANWAIPQFGISYAIRESKRGEGFATEAAHTLARLAFEVLQAKKVEIYCDQENVASCRVPEKLKFELEYTQRGGWPRPDGQLATLRTYSIFDVTKLPELQVTW